MHSFDYDSGPIIGEKPMKNSVNLKICSEIRTVSHRPCVLKNLHIAHKELLVVVKGT